MTTPLSSPSGPATPAYVADIRRQPRALQDLLDAPIGPEARKLVSGLGKFSRVILTGMGASLHALYPTFLTLASAGVPAWHLETSELLGEAAGLITPGSLLWITSQSGRSAEVVALLDRLTTKDRAAVSSQRPAVLGFTNDTASPLAQAADVVIELRCGDEHTVGTRSYLNSLAAHLLATAAALGRQIPAELHETPAKIADYLDGWDEHLTTWDQAVTEPILFTAGRGTSLAAARTGALIVKEAAKTPIEAISAPQFRHGPLEMADSRTCVIVLAGAPTDAPLNTRLASDLSAFGANTILLAPPGHSSGPQLPAVRSDPVRPIGEILPFQVLSVLLAQRLGLEPGAFRQIDKVTTTL